MVSRRVFRNRCSTPKVLSISAQPDLHSRNRLTCLGRAPEAVRQTRCFHHSLIFQGDDIMASINSSRTSLSTYLAFGSFLAVVTLGTLCQLESKTAFGQSTPQTCVLVANNTCPPGACQPCRQLFQTCSNVTCTYKNQACNNGGNSSTPCVETLVSMVSGQTRQCGTGPIDWTTCYGANTCITQQINDVAGAIYSC